MNERQEKYMNSIRGMHECAKLLILQTQKHILNIMLHCNMSYYNHLLSVNTLATIFHPSWNFLSICKST